MMFDGKWKRNPDAGYWVLDEEQVIAKSRWHGAKHSHHLITHNLIILRR